MKKIFAHFLVLSRQLKGDLFFLMAILSVGQFDC